MTSSIPFHLIYRVLQLAKPATVIGLSEEDRPREDKQQQYISAVAQQLVACTRS